MKTILVVPTVALLTTLGALTSPAEAGKRVTPRPKAPPPAEPASAIIPVKEQALKFNFGEDFALAPKTAAPPSGEVEEELEAKPVANWQVNKVLEERTIELEYCWLKLPAAKRTAGTASLTLMIEASGSVAGAFVDGAVPASVSTCIEKVASRWAFPVADAGCEVEHALAFKTMKSRTDALR